MASNCYEDKILNMAYEVAWRGPAPQLHLGLFSSPSLFFFFFFFFGEAIGNFIL